MGQSSPFPTDEALAQSRREAAFEHGLNYLNIHKDSLKPLIDDALLKQLQLFVTACLEAHEVGENFDAESQLAPFARKSEARA